MKTFTENEKNIIREIVRKGNSINNAHVNYLIYEYMDVFRISWNASRVLIENPKKNATLDQNKLWNKFCEIIFLLKYLENNYYIQLSRLSIKPTSEIFNAVKYKKLHNGKYIDSESGEIIYTKRYHLLSDMEDLLNSQYNSMFYVSNTLRDLVYNNFKTPEDIRHKREILTAYAAIAFSLIIGTSSLFMSLENMKSSSQSHYELMSFILDLFEFNIKSNQLSLPSKSILINTMDEQYTLEEVQSLIDWFKGRDLPKELQLNEAIYIPDLAYSIENISTQALNHWENPLFNGNMRLLQEIKEKLESLE